MCGITGRHISVKTRLLQDIVDDLNNRGMGGAILPLDQEKAFDRVDWAFLLRVLRKMNFGDSFCQWIMLFYSHIHSCLLLNGELTEFFPVLRGVRQGCPISPLLYVIMDETIASAIRADPLIDGFTIPGSDPVKLCEYADDTSIIVLSDASLNAVFALFSRYELASGAKLNVEKSHGLLVGSWRSRTKLPITLNWSSSSITILGFELVNDVADRSWANRLAKLDTVLATWKTRQLSFHGRALVINFLGLSLFWYLCSFLVMPDQVVTAVKPAFFPFSGRSQKDWPKLRLLNVRVTEAWVSWMWSVKFSRCMSCGFGIWSLIQHVHPPFSFAFIYAPHSLAGRFNKSFSYPKHPTLR